MYTYVLTYVIIHTKIIECTYRNKDNSIIVKNRSVIIFEINSYYIHPRLVAFICVYTYVHTYNNTCYATAIALLLWLICSRRVGRSSYRLTRIEIYCVIVTLTSHVIAVIIGSDIGRFTKSSSSHNVRRQYVYCTILYMHNGNDMR